jgi:hypothetical protein
MALTADTAQDLYSSPAREHPQAEGTFGIGEVSSPGGTVLGEGSLTISVETSDVDKHWPAEVRGPRSNSEKCTRNRSWAGVHDHDAMPAFVPPR